MRMFEWNLDEDIEEFIEEEEEDCDGGDKKFSMLEFDLANQIELYKICLNENIEKDNKIESLKEELINLRDSIDRILKNLE